MLRSLGILVTVLYACAVAVATWPQFFRLENTLPFAQIIAMRGALVVVFAALTLLFLLFAAARKIRGFALSMAIVSMLAAVASGVILGMRGYGSSDLPAKTDTSLRVMTWNTAGNAAGSDSIAQTAVAMEADIVVLPETAHGVGEEAAVLMRDLGRPMWVLGEQYNADIEHGPQAWQTTFLISPELGDYAVIDASRDGTTMLPTAIAMPIEHDGPIIVAAHAVSPRPEYMDAWRTDLAWLADQCVDGNVILAGDFNATIDHMARLGAEDNDLGWCRDAATATGDGAVGTWPTSLPSLLGAPIDHVLHTSQWVATGSVVLTSLDDAGSDHRPLIVQLDAADTE
ncbi:endonuclease/exonuclease/phosphatase family protein [Microbacterium amylolyticum]|uniref:Endonuclease/exonuclease/phosphatase (EEP) superfamily protein YafD n=1 Tax=Microbacterium amylolyticum TaxID=936337 RepID=A0ABS4ZKF0_9MICO|nr:endonuclease/exonuclease/phosphatase family protein [Microbacterium amylolyticum]MBP2437771.1 endonuclease/exonuclease/phosphatase (EEP) superfamily protein YafD [Microbacterium amylolyticum]